MKIAILGYSGSGKSTLAKYLGEQLSLPVLYLDKVEFCEGWKERDRAEQLQIVTDFMEQDRWVIDGNYRRLLQERRLAEADRIVFLNFNRVCCLLRALRRHRQFRGSVRDSIADGCIEKMDFAFVKWILHDGRTRSVKEHYKQVLAQYQTKVTVLHNQRELDAFWKAPLQ